MEEAAKAGLPVFVLDRPNPIGGMVVEGPIADADKLSFTAYHTIPVRHGMTIGELAQLFNQRAKDQLRFAGHQDGGLAACHVVRRDEPDLGQPFPEYAQPDRGDALSRRRSSGDDERLSWEGNRYAF